MIRRLTLTIALLMAGALEAKDKHFNSLGVPDSSAERVSIATLIANPAQFDGKPVRVVGAFRLQFEKSRVCPAHQDLVSGRTKNCLWISLDHQRLGDGAKSLSSHNDKSVVMEGRFSMKMRGHLNQFPGSIGRIWYVMESSTSLD